MGEIFARKQPNLSSLTYHDMQSLVDNADAKSYAALSRSCRSVHDSCKPSLDKYQDEAEERFERHIDLNQARQECEMQDLEDDRDWSEGEDFMVVDPRNGALYYPFE